MTTKSDIENETESSLPIVLKNFSGEASITVNAFAFRDKAVALAKTILEVKDEAAMKPAVEAMRGLATLRKGIEAARKARLAPVQALREQINTLASDFMADALAEEERLKGMVNHYQLKVMEAQREEQRRVDAEKRKIEQEALFKQQEIERQEREAARLRDLAAVAGKKEADKLRKQAEEAENKSVELSLEIESAPEPVQAVATVAHKPAGLVVKAKFDFQVLDPKAFYLAFPRFWKWDEKAETISVRRMDFKEELNKGETCMFTRDEKDVPRVAGVNVFFDAKTHIR